ncbi:hypothetical protein [Mycobacteroides franklinii]|uniref:hypothetical protein n=1 Tax=Mycobacteroides franklinii TaxID=948102 RepID=UPI0013E8CCDE|nr:hypothetical protein [Mycobacteroides franklinii]
MVKVFAVSTRKGETWQLDLAAVPRVGDKVQVVDETEAEVKKVLWLPQPNEYHAKLEVNVLGQGRMIR